jgi:hypothetical protein
VVERVRLAKTPEAAVLLMKRHFRSALDLQDKLRDVKIKRERNVGQAMKEYHERVRAMAKAMAGPDKEWGQFYERAAELDAALRARRTFEI